MPSITPAGAALIVAVLIGSTAVFADPPSHAPAHGWRKKHDPYYIGYTGREWGRDYGVLAGRCNREEIGTVLGAAVGGAVGSRIGDGSGRTVAIVVGTVLGAVIGREIGRDLDDRDRACVGHALELAGDGQTVRWVNETSGVSYVVTPAAPAHAGDTCRNYELTAERGGHATTTDHRACRLPDGSWKSVG